MENQRLKDDQTKPLRVLYFGIFNPSFSRNHVYIEGLRRNGLEITICTDTSRGLLKYWQLFKKHWKIRRDYDFMIVGFPGYIIVPFAKLITRKPVIFDALCSFYETQIISRDAYRGNPFRIPYVRMIDWLATRFADKILVETFRQKEYFVKELGAKEDKCIVTYTGVSDTDFYVDSSVERFNKFTVLFRGRITRESGATTVIRAAKLLENYDVDFLIVGFGWDDVMEEFYATMDQVKPRNVRHILGQLPIDGLRRMMLECHVSLGQFGDNERLDRTIPHKAFEAMVMKLPYITARTSGIAEIFKDNENCLMVNVNDPRDLADKVLQLTNDSSLANRLAENSHNLYLERFTPEKIVQPIIEFMINR